MPSILDLVQQSLGDQGVSALASRLGTDQATAGQAVSAALPALIAALARNAQTPGGADALAGAIDRDHDGAILGNVTDFINGGGSPGGDAILGHLFGSQQPGVQQVVGQASGLSAGNAGALMAMLAPVVMGALGQASRSGGGQITSGALAGMLSSEHQELAAQGAPGLGALGALLDQNHDGSVMDDVARLASGFFQSER